MSSGTPRKSLYGLLIAFLAGLFWPASAAAQFTLVSGTVTDPSGIPYDCGTISAQLVVPGGTAPTLNGASFTASTSPVRMGCTLIPGSGTPGSFTMLLADNTVIQPVGTQWIFTVGIAPGILPPAGTGPQSFSVAITISGASQSVSAALTAAASHLGANILAGTHSGTETFNGPLVNTGTDSGAQTISGNKTFSGTNTHTGAETFGKLNGICVVDGTLNATLAAAVTCAGSSGTIWIQMGAVPALTASVTIPAGVTLQFFAPSCITTTGFTLTINGPLLAPPVQIFCGTGTVNLLTNYSVKEVFPQWWGATGDGKVAEDGAITTGTAVLTSAQGKFNCATDVGKPISVGTAKADGSNFTTTILSCQSATQVTLAANAGATVSGVNVYWGTDNSTPFINTMTATAGTAIFFPPAYQTCKSISIPSGLYYVAAPEVFHFVQGHSGCKMEGAGMLTTTLFLAYDAAPCATTAASWTSNVVTFTMGCNPLNNSYAVNQLAYVSGFTGADTFFNSTLTTTPTGGGTYCFITSVTSTQIVCTPSLTHANGTATSNGTVNIAFSMYNFEPVDKLLAYYKISGISFIGPGGAGTHYHSAELFSENLHTTSPILDHVSYEGFQTMREVGPSTTSGGGQILLMSNLRVRDVNKVFHILNSQVTPMSIIEADICTSSQAGATIFDIDGLAAQTWSITGYLCTLSATGSIVKVESTFNGASNSVVNGFGVHYELYGGGGSTAQLFDGSSAALGQFSFHNFGSSLATVNGAAGRSVATVTDAQVVGWWGGEFGQAGVGNGVTLTCTVNCGNNYPSAQFTIENAKWNVQTTCSASSNITVNAGGGSATHNPHYRVRGITCNQLGAVTQMPDAVFGIPSQSSVISNQVLRSANTVSDQGAICTNGELALSAGWQSTGSATVTAVAGNGQTCSWTITTGTTTAANPTITDTLTNALPAATTVCWMNIYGGTHTAVAGESLRQTTLSATAPIFTANFTPTAGGTTYFVTRGCGP